jgi:hypothetical protein
LTKIALEQNLQEPNTQECHDYLVYSSSRESLCKL